MVDETKPGKPVVASDARPATEWKLPLDIEQPAARPDIDLVAYWRMLAKRRWVVLGILAAVLVLTLVVTLLATPVYRATTVLEIDEHVQQVVQVDGMAGQPQADAQFQQTQYELLRSRSLAERVARDIGADAATIQALSDDAAVPASPPERLELVTSLIQQGTTIEPVRDSALVRVHFDSTTPEMSAKVANALAQAFIQSHLERRYGASNYAKKYLQEQLRDVKARLEASERQLVEFAQAQGLVSSPDGQSLAANNLADLNEALAAAQSQRIRTQARWAQAAGGGALPADMLDSSTIRALRESRAKLQAEYQEKLQQFEPGYPAMQQLKSQIDALDRQVAAELQNIRSSVRAEYNAAAAQERLLQSKLDALRAAALDVDSRSIEYNILKREVDTNRELYDGLLQRYKQVGVAGDQRSDNISVIDPARVPERPFKPDLPVNLALGLLLGLLLGVSAAFLLEYMDETLKTPADVEQKLHLPVLGVVPRVEHRTPMVAFEDPRSAFSESYRSVRTALQFSTNQGIPRSLLITSALSGEGKTTSALSLARNVAQLGKRVLLVDGDLRNPSLHKLTGLPGERGLSNLLSNAAVFDAVVKETRDAGLSVILAGPLPPNPAELLTLPRFEDLLSYLREQYDFVLIDTPALLSVTDPSVVAPRVDGVLLAIRLTKNGRPDAERARELLESIGTRLIGVVINGTDRRTKPVYAADRPPGETPPLSPARTELVTGGPPAVIEPLEHSHV